MSRQYSIDDIAKYKAGSGYGDWIANLQAIQSGKGFVSGVPTPEYYIGDVPPQEGDGNTFSGSKGTEPTNVTKFLRRYGLYRIRNIYVGRELSTDRSRLNLFFQIMCYDPEDGTPLNVLLYRANKVRIEIGYKPRDLQIVQRAFSADNLNDFVRHLATPKTWTPEADIDTNDYGYIEDRLKAHRVYNDSSNLKIFMKYTLDLNEDGKVSQYAIPVRPPTIVDGIPAGEQIAEVVIDDDDDPPQEGSGYSEWKRNIAKLKKMRPKLRGGANESVLNEHGDKKIERLFIMKAHDIIYIIHIRTDSNDFGLYFDGQPTLFANDRSSNISTNSQNTIEIPLQETITLRQFMTKHSEDDDRFPSSYEYVVDRMDSNNLITSLDIVNFLNLQPEEYDIDPNSDTPDLLRPD